MAKSTKKPEPIDFEAAMRDLESLVEKMEEGEFTLEESITQFERGIKLARSCQQALRVAEQKVQKLALDGNAESLENFDVPEQP